jgi:hypothetical protein
VGISESMVSSENVTPPSLSHVGMLMVLKSCS